MTEKKKAGRPKNKVKNSTIELNWKDAYLNLIEENEKRNNLFESFKQNASEVIGEMADNQLNVINVVLDAVDSIEEHCTQIIEQTNHLDITDVTYMVNVAKRRLLATYSQMQDTEE